MVFKFRDFQKNLKEFSKNISASQNNFMSDINCRVPDEAITCDGNTFLCHCEIIGLERKNKYFL